MSDRPLAGPLPSNTELADALLPYLEKAAEHGSWLFQCSDDERHTIQVVEDTLGKSVLELLAKSAAEAIGFGD